jgi:DNA-directed RNA polymerase specialized sigma24 family protein
MDGQRLLDDRAREHAAHPRWLGARCPTKLLPEALEEVLQDAYAKAMTALTRKVAATFHCHDDARGRFRRVADRTAIDALRARDGRRPGLRPQVVELSDDGPLLGEDLEESLLGAAERDHRMHMIARDPRAARRLSARASLAL